MSRNMEPVTRNSESRIVFPKSSVHWFGPMCKCKVSTYLDNYSYGTTEFYA